MIRLVLAWSASLAFAIPSILPSAELVSRDASGVLGNDDSDDPELSSEGRYVAFESDSTNLVMGDTNGFEDIYRKDRDTADIVRVSVPNGGGEPNQDCSSPKISANGQYVFFRSAATNLVSGDMNDAVDIFRRDLVNNTTIRVSTPDVGETADEGNGDANFFNISSDGRFVAFQSFASNLVMNDTNGFPDIFLKDLDNDTTVLVSTTSGGGQANFDNYGASVSDDGNLVAFTSLASNLVAGDTNTFVDVFLKNVTTGAIVRTNTDAAGNQTNQHTNGFTMSPDGAFIAFDSLATNLVPGDTNGSYDIFVKEVATGAISRVSTSSSGAQGNGDSRSPDFGDGTQVIAFNSEASNLLPGDSNGFEDCFVKNLGNGLVTRVSASASDALGNADSTNVELSSDGAFAVFDSNSSNLVADDTNNAEDVFVKPVQFIPPAVQQPDPNAILKAQLLQKIKKLKKKAKASKKKGKVAKAKKLKKKIKKLTKKVRAL